MRVRDNWFFDLRDMQTLVTEQDYKDAINLCKARAYHYQRLGWTQFAREDLISAGYEGICEAANRFDPSKGTVKATKFTSYAYFWIEKYIREHIARNKSVLSGNLSECWRGLVPYADSIDVYDADSEQSGLDHKSWIADQSNANDRIENLEHCQEQADLLASMFIELRENERTVLMLSLGIGTVTGDHMTIRDLADAMDMSIGKVHGIIQSAKANFEIIKAKYRKQAEAIW